MRELKAGKTHLPVFPSSDNNLMSTIQNREDAKSVCGQWHISVCLFKCDVIDMSTILI